MAFSKTVVLKEILAKLTAEVALYARAARAAHAEATDEQSRAENKYDTRGLEASYLARGQSRQAAEVEQALAQFQALSTRDFPPETPVGVGTLVELVSGREHQWYFIGPRAGGLEVTCDKIEVTVLTPHSPLGGELMGRKQGDRVRLDLGGAKRELRLTHVS
ncbi:MAG TPA: transcription elongation factor GreAB [Verrucomicrobiota bacterium]|nr:transcription elongation factor GreAB [Verrucomicrobiota bacterium]